MKNLLMTFINYLLNFGFNQLVFFSRLSIYILKSTYLAKRFDLIIILILLKASVVFEIKISVKFSKELIKVLKFLSLISCFLKRRFHFAIALHICVLN